MMREPIETEAKFICPAGLTAADVSTVLEGMGLTVRWHKPQMQIDTYFDTTDGALRDANASLRLRRIGEISLGTMKLPKSRSEAVMERHEIEWGIPADNMQGWTKRPEGFPWIPSDVATKLQEYGVQSVAPVLTIATSRRKGNVIGADGFLAEVALDEATLTGRRGEAKQRELELELKAGHTGRLREVAEALSGQFGLQPSAQSKFAAGMERVG